MYNFCDLWLVSEEMTNDDPGTIMVIFLNWSDAMQ